MHPATRTPCLTPGPRRLWAPRGFQKALEGGAFILGARPPLRAPVRCSQRAHQAPPPEPDPAWPTRLACSSPSPPQRPQRDRQPPRPCFPPREALKSASHRNVTCAPFTITQSRATPMPFKRRNDQRNVLQPPRGTSLHLERTGRDDTALSADKPVAKVPFIGNARNRHTRRAASRSGGRGWSDAQGSGSLAGGESVLELDRGGGCTALGTCRLPLK